MMSKCRDYLYDEGYFDDAVHNYGCDASRKGIVVMDDDDAICEYAVIINDCEIGRDYDE